MGLNFMVAPQSLKAALYQAQQSKEVLLLVGSFIVSICLFELAGLLQQEKTRVVSPIARL